MTDNTMTLENAQAILTAYARARREHTANNLQMPEKLRYWVEPVPQLGAEAVEVVVAEVERLRDALPKTADGVVVVPGMRVWNHDWITALGRVVLKVGGQNHMRLGGCTHKVFRGDEVSSTHEAAEAAETGGNYD